MQDCSRTFSVVFKDELDSRFTVHECHLVKSSLKARRKCSFTATIMQSVLCLEKESEHVPFLSYRALNRDEHFFGV